MTKRQLRSQIMPVRLTPRRIFAIWLVSSGAIAVMISLLGVSLAPAFASRSAARALNCKTFDYYSPRCVSTRAATAGIDLAAGRSNAAKTLKIQSTIEAGYTGEASYTGLIVLDGVARDHDNEISKAYLMDAITWLDQTYWRLFFDRMATIADYFGATTSP